VSLAALTPCHDAGFRLRKARACVRQDQADIAWLWPDPQKGDVT
jgi:hypothetical protein